jgi:hypothetical protein
LIQGAQAGEHRIEEMQQDQREQFVIVKLSVGAILVRMQAAQEFADRREELEPLDVLCAQGRARLTTAFGRFSPLTDHAGQDTGADRQSQGEK